MCLAIPGIIKKIDGQSAWVEYPTHATKIILGGTSAKLNDYVMVQMGVAIKTLSKAEANLSLKSWQSSI